MYVMPYTKEQRKEYNKKYRENNKDKIAKQKKEWNEKNKDKIKEQRKEYKKEYYENNKDKIKEYYENNKDKILEQASKRGKEYYNSDVGYKTKRIYAWKGRGVICDDFESLYEYYINCNNCEECNIELVKGDIGVNKKCLDHDHLTGKFRNVLCCSCNVKRG